jgi:hypothetical protein
VGSIALGTLEGRSVIVSGCRDGAMRMGTSTGAPSRWALVGHRGEASAAFWGRRWSGDRIKSRWRLLGLDPLGH